MKKIMREKYYLLAMLLIASVPVIHSKQCGKTPRLTIIFIAEQTPLSQLQRLAPFFTGGIKFLLNNGFNYTNASYPQGTNSTAPGHAALSTGAFAQSHGMVRNPQWFENGNAVFTTTDRSGLPAQVYTATGTPCIVYPVAQTFDSGQSNRNLLVDTLGDQLEFFSTPASTKQFYFVSLADIASANSYMPAGQLGKPFTFDAIQGGFTSTQAFFANGLPQWVIDWNKSQHFDQLNSWVQNLAYPANSPAYNLPFIDNYDFASAPSRIGVTQTITHCPQAQVCSNIACGEPFFDYSESPDAIERAFDFLQTLINHELSGTDQLVIYVNLLVNAVQSTYGPLAKDSVDMLYHYDILLGKFISNLFKKVDKKEVLLGFTADEGAVGMPQLWQEAGYANASLININNVRTAINNAVSAVFPQVIALPSRSYIGFTQIWMGPDFFNNAKVNDAQRQQILQIVKNTLATFKGIKRIWTFDELYNSTFQLEEEERYLQLELFPGRSGQIVYSTFPINGIWLPTGSNHFTIWDQDHHVPLILYQKDRFEKKTIHEPVWINQLPITLAEILNVPRPSAAPRIFGPLPAIFKQYSPTIIP